MRRIKHFIAFTLVMVLLLTTVPVQAKEPEQGLADVQEWQTGVYEKEEPELIYPRKLAENAVYAYNSGSGLDSLSVDEKASLFRNLEERISDTLLAGKYVVDLTGVDMDYYTFLDIYSAGIIPYFGKGIRPYDFTEGECMNIINPFSEEETQELVNTINGRIAEIDNLITNEMTDAEKALAIHDYLIYRFEYDYDNYLNGTIPTESYQCSGLLMNGMGVCQAYAMTYMYFMIREGIDCYVMSSSAMNHAWNIVNIDGSHYHVDCTWDDPVPDQFGKVRHSHFLVSDDKMQNELDHYGWNRTDLVCDSTVYDNAYWTDINSQIIGLNGPSYYIKGRAVWKKDGETEKELIQLGIWPVWESSGSYWTTAYSGLFWHDGYLYYNTYDKICRFSPDTMESEVVYEPDISEGYVYGIRDSGTEIEYIIKQSYQDEGMIYTAPVSLDESDETPETPEYVLGDVDDSGNVNIADLRVVLRTVCGKVQLTEKQKLAADVVVDGNVDIEDLRMLLRYICGKVDSFG